MAKVAKSTKKSNVIPIKAKAKAKGSTKAAPEAAPKKEKKAAASKYIGKTTSMRVQEFQDDLMKKNYKAKKTDTQLASEMRAEFPNAVKFTEDHVAGIRSQFNNGRRPSQDGVKPAKPLAKFDEEGNEVNPRTKSEGASKKAAKGKAPAKKSKPAVEEEEEDEEETDDEGDEDDSDDEEEEEETEEE